MEGLVCWRTIRSLLAKLLRDVEPEGFAAIAGHKEFPHPAILDSVLGEDLARRYSRAWTEISRELVPQHIAQSELNDALWALFREVAADSASYRRTGALKARLDRFGVEAKRHLYAFEVAYSIDNLDLGGEQFSIGRVRFFTMDDKESTLWGLKEDNGPAAGMLADMMHHAAAAVEVQAADHDRALEAGLPQVAGSMDLLRLAGVRGVISGFDDRLFLWRLSGRAVARQIRPDQASIAYHSQHWFRPFIIETGAYIKKGLDPEVSGLYAMANAELPGEISRHFERAVSWISSSITRERLDDKIIDLCTALEILLLPGYTGPRKGHMIALRHRLVGGEWNPVGIVSLYDLRSRIVHGSDSNVAHYQDYWHLLLICSSTLDSLIRLAKRNPTVQNLKDLVGRRETRDNLETFMHLFRTRLMKGKKARGIKSLARSCLRKV